MLNKQSMHTSSSINNAHRFSKNVLVFLVSFFKAFNCYFTH